MHRQASLLKPFIATARIGCLIMEHRQIGTISRQLQLKSRSGRLKFLLGAKESELRRLQSALCICQQRVSAMQREFALPIAADSAAPSSGSDPSLSAAAATLLPFLSALHGYVSELCSAHRSPQCDLSAAREANVRLGGQLLVRQGQAPVRKPPSKSRFLGSGPGPANQTSSRLFGEKAVK